MKVFMKHILSAVGIVAVVEGQKKYDFKSEWPKRFERTFTTIGKTAPTTTLIRGKPFT